MSTLAERKGAELAAKRLVLVDELAFWQTLTVEKGLLQKHRSQVERLDRVLAEALTGLAAPTDADVIATWAATTEQLLGLHHVWDFFRSKLALRLVERFRQPLIAADELAWACTRPYYMVAVQAGAIEMAAVREPALAYFDTAGSPFALARNQAYRNLLPAKRLGDIPSRLLRSLPVPVIAIPWHQQAHFAETAIVAHEAAHVIDDDLDLSEAVRPMLEGTDFGARAPDWGAWLPEVLADVLGALQLGPAYAQSLVDVLATAPSAVPDDMTPTGSTYPPARTRVELVAATLRLLGHCAEADAVLSTWRQSQPAEKRSSHDDDVVLVVDVLGRTPLPALGGASLSSIEPFDQAKQKRAVGDADRLRVGFPLTSHDVRELVAAGVIAFADDPAAFFAKGMPATVLSAIEKRREPGTRSAAAAAPPSADKDESFADQVAARDAATAGELLTLL